MRTIALVPLEHELKKPRRFIDRGIPTRAGELRVKLLDRLRPAHKPCGLNRPERAILRIAPVATPKAHSESAGL
jgi:hypothetical protein